MKFDENSILNRKKKAKTIRIILFILLIVILYNIIIVVISSVEQDDEWSLFGYKAYIITSDSMSPKIDIGDVIIVKLVAKDKLKTDDIITFKRDGKQIVTHRIIEIKEENGKEIFITKGDNNKTGDEKSISFDQIKGKVVLTIPYLGNVIEFLSDKLIFLIILLIILIICFLYINKNERKEIRFEKRYKDKKK